MNIVNKRRGQRQLTLAGFIGRAAARPYGLLLLLLTFPLLADQVIMKDGTVYKGKIQLDTEKAILIGNPPFDPVTYLLETKDIDKIIYEEYRPSPPAERRRGLMAALRMDGNVISSDELAMRPAPSLGFEAGFRIHPFVELNGGVDWAAFSSRSALTVADSLTPPTLRRYESFTRLRAMVGTRLYPFFQKKWKTEPYLSAGYTWGSLAPSGSGDSLKGSGWLFGTGAHYPLSKHWFLDGRMAYERMNYDQIRFLGQKGTLRPEIIQNAFVFGVALAYRL